MSSKTQQNERFLAEQIRRGRDYVFKNELPWPELASRCDSVLAVEGSRIYLRRRWR